MQLVTHSNIFSKVIQEGLLEAEHTVWIATANLKDMHVPGRGRYQPILQVFDRLAAEGVQFRVLHADLPSQRFRDTLERFPRLTGGALELQICPRSHWKMALVDGRFAYMGSANFTGAGLGAKGPDKRNFELGVVTRDPQEVEELSELFDQFWIGEHCPSCKRRELCPDPIR